MFKFIEILKQWPILQKFSSNLNTCLKYLQNVFKNYFESVLAGALISLLVGFVYGLTCPNNIFQYFVRACASLGLTCVNGHLVLFLGLIMVCLDGLILLCLTLFKHCKTSNTVHMILFMGNVCAMITAGLPLFWEANTDSSFAMFALFKNSPVFWIYGAFMGLSLTLGLIMLRPYVIKPNVVFVQALCIIVSDVPMFLAGFFGFPTGVLTNICVNIFFAGLGLKLSQVYEHRIRVWVQKAPFKMLMPNQKTDFAPALFGFLASSRLLSWALASVYGPTNWCASLEPRFCSALFFILCVVWQFSSVKLLAASLNPINSARFIPFEPVLVYNRLVHPYVIVFGTYISLQNVLWYRRIMRVWKPFLGSNPMFKRIFGKLLAQRLSLISAILCCRMPNQSELLSPWLGELDKQQVVVYASRIPISQTTGGQAWKMLGGVSGLFTFLGVGVLGMHNVEIQQQTQAFKTDYEGVENIIKTVDEEQLPTEVKKEYHNVKNSNAIKSGVVNQVEHSSFLSINDSKADIRAVNKQDGMDLTRIRRLPGYENINKVYEFVDVLPKKR